MKTLTPEAKRMLIDPKAKDTLLDFLTTSDRSNTEELITLIGGTTYRIKRLDWRHIP